MRALAVVALLAACAVPAGSGGTASRGGLIVFASDRAENLLPQTYAVPAAGGRRRNVSRAPTSSDQAPVPSPDGSRLLFVSSRRDVPELWVSRTDGSGRRRLARGEDASWSPNGARVAFVDYDTYALVVVGEDGRGLRTLRPGLVAAPVWSTDGRRIAFVARDVGELHVIDADGANEHRLGAGTGAPSWSPGGRVVVAAASALHVFDADTGGEETLAVPPPAFVSGSQSFTVESPLWSPDGRRIVFVAGNEDTTRTEVDVIGADGSGFRRLTGPNDFGYDPAWSPDGGRIALSRRRGITTMGPDGSRPRVVATARPLEFLDAPSWSPDGRTIFFTGQIGGLNQTDLYTIRPDGGGLRRLTDDSAFEYQPRWSPDGRWIAFVRTPRFLQGYALYVMRAGGGGLRLVHRCRDECSWPAWSPDGRRILFSEGLERPLLKIVPASGGRARTIGSGVEPSWSRSRNLIAYAGGAIFVAQASGAREHVVVRQADSRYDSNPAWSPDGRTLAFVRGEDCERECGVWSIALVRPGGGARKLQLPASPETPAWSPDARRLAYVDDGGRLAVATASGRGVRILVGAPGQESGPDWKP